MTNPTPIPPTGARTFKWNAAVWRVALRVWLCWSAVMSAFFLALMASKPASQPILLPVGLGLAIGALLVWIYVPVHVRRTVALVGTLTDEALANRHHRRIELPMSAEDAYAMLLDAFADLPGMELRRVEPELKRIHAHVERLDAYGMNFTKSTIGDHIVLMASDRRGEAGDGATSAGVEIWSGPNMPRWLDWALPDLGSNLQHVETICRVIAQRVAARRAAERAEAEKVALARQVAEARLSALQSQVEPHFLYNTLATAQVLTRIDPERAHAMMGHLIHFLRAGLRSEASRGQLGQEVERLSAYLAIMKIRMGERLSFDIRVAPDLKALPFPAMVLQMLVENAIKHGLEPKPAGGSVSVEARTHDGHLIVEVKDDGRGLGDGTAGSGVGLKNIRERIQLEYGGAGSFTLSANHPSGIIARVTIPTEADPTTDTGNKDAE